MTTQKKLRLTPEQRALTPIRIPMPLRYLINLTLILCLWLVFRALITGGVITNYWTGILITVGINIILAVSLNVATGYLGQLPLGHAGFMAVGAYAGGIFMKATPAAELLKSGQNAAALPYILAALVLSAVIAGVFGLVIGIPALRLRGDYLAIITLGFGEIIRVVLTNTVVHMIMKSRHGRAILSIRENEIASESVGIPTTYYKTFAFAASAMLAGMAGCLYAGYLGSLYPATFKFMKSIEILVMVVLGGMGSMLGSVLSASVLTVLPEALRSVEYSLALVVMMIFRPKGLLGSYDFSMSKALERILNTVFRPKLRAAKKKEGSDHVQS